LILVNSAAQHYQKLVIYNTTQLDSPISNKIQKKILHE